MTVTLNDTLGVKRGDIKHYDFGMPFWEATRQKKLVTIALNRVDGLVLWERESPYRKLESIHNIGSHAQPSPAPRAMLPAVIAKPDLDP